MRRFALQQNIQRYRQYLSGEISERDRATCEELLITAQRSLALMEADLLGTQRYRGEFQSIHARPEANVRLTTLVRDLFEAAQAPSLLLDPGPGLHILDINTHYAQATMTVATRIGGMGLFDAFPDNPDDLGADGVSNLFASLQAAAESGAPHAMAIQRYDIRNDAGAFVERYWQPVNTPLLDEDGRLLFLLHQVRDVTGQVLARRERDAT